MAEVNPDTLISATLTKSAISNLFAGTKLAAEIVGPTRYGLVVRSNNDSFILKTEAKLTNASSITIKISKKISDGLHKVHITAVDGQPLDKAVKGELANRPKAQVTPAVATTIARNHQITVGARLASFDGKPFGPSLTIELSIISRNEAPKSDRVSGNAITAHQPNLPSTGQRTLGIGLNPSEISSKDSSSQKRLGALIGAELNNQATPRSPLMEQSSTATLSKTMIMDPASSPKAISAVVSGRAANTGALLVTAENGHIYRVEPPIDLPVGTSLGLTLKANDALMTGGRSFSETAQLNKLIELLEKIEQPSLYVRGSEQADTVQKLPAADRHLAAKMLLLMSSQFRHWSDEGSPYIADQKDISAPKRYAIQNLLSEIGQAMSDTLADGWRGTTLPLGSDPTQAVIIYYRENHADLNSDREEIGEAQDPAQRAVFDVSFKNLGRCQIDVLCQKQKFDLLIRSEQELETTDQKTITDLFISTCEISGFQGDIAYRQGGFIDPEKRPTSHQTVLT